MSTKKLSRRNNSIFETERCDKVFAHVLPGRFVFFCQKEEFGTFALPELEDGIS